MYCTDIELHCADTSTLNVRASLMWSFNTKTNKPGLREREKMCQIMHEAIDVLTESVGLDFEI